MSDEMRLDYVPLSEVAPWKRNPKRHAEGVLDRSLARFGYVAPVVLDEGSGRLVAGHGRVEALRRLKESGGAPPERVRVREDGEWLVPALRGIEFASEQEAEAYLVADNRLVELGGWDDSMLASILRDQDQKLDGIGFGDDDGSRMLAEIAGPQPPEAPEEFKAFDETIETKHACPKCGYEWS